jgi:hypothetical protein
MRRMLPLGIFILCTVLCCSAAQNISATEAGKHTGEKATVCGVVASTRYAEHSKGRPTFLNLDKPYPNTIFTVLIWGEDRFKFKGPEVQYRDKQICTTGTITSYRGTPEMVLKEPSQIRVTQ